MAIKINDVQITWEHPSGLLANPRNHRTHPKAQATVLRSAFEREGWIDPIIVNTTTGHIIDGHLRVALANEEGLESVPVIRIAVPEKEERIILARHDRIGDLAEIDLTALKENVLELEGDGVALDELGWTDIFDTDDTPAGGFTDEDEVPEVQEVTVSTLGDLWVMGNHRLLCGDSTSTDAFARLMGKSGLADFIFTDPPWNVDYSEVAHHILCARSIMNDNLGEAFAPFCEAFAAQMKAFSRPGAAIYLVMGSSEWPGIDRVLRSSGFHWSSTIIWVKDSLVLSHKDYHTQYEPIWYGWNDGGGRLVPVSDRTQSDVWEIARPKRSELHPTTKPVELIERAITNSSKRGNTVLDPFGGSGSTLIAAERLGRNARLVELDPKHADVIVRRWQEFTGKDATRESDGKTFSEVAVNA